MQPNAHLGTVSSRQQALPTHGEMKRLPGNPTADSLTCYVREADANSLSSLEQSAPSSRSNYSESNSIATLFLLRQLPRSAILTISSVLNLKFASLRRGLQTRLPLSARRSSYRCNLHLHKSCRLPAFYNFPVRAVTTFY